MEKYRDNMQQPTHTVMRNTAPDAELNPVTAEVQSPIIASNVCMNESELETSSLEAARVVRVADKGQDADTIFKGDHMKMTSQPMLDTSNVDNLQTPYSTDMVSSNSLAPEFNIMREISKGKRASICEENCTEKSHKYCAERSHTDSAADSEQQSPTGQVAGDGQVSETHNEVSSFVEGQGDEMTDETQETQTAACTVGSAKDGVTLKINSGAQNHSVSTLPQLLFEVRPTYTPASASTQTDNEVENIDTDSSACYIHQQTEICNFVSTKGSSEFEPVILNVCGDYHEMETDGLNGNQNLTSLEGSANRQKSENATVKNTNTENIQAAELVSKPASDLLQGMVQYAVSASQKPKKSSTRDIIVRIDKCNTNSDRKLPKTNHPLLYIDTSIETNKGKYPERQGNCLIENASPNTDTVLSTKSLMIPRAADDLLSESGFIHITKKVPQSASLKTPAVSAITSSVSSESAPNKSSQILPNILVNPTQSAVLPTTYSCVYVQDHSNGNQGKVAFLVPQSSLSDLSFLTNITSSVLSKMPVTELQTNVSGAFTSPVASSILLSNNDNVTVMDRISKFVTNTVNSFYLQGKDLIDTNLLKIVKTKRKESSLHAANCSICGESYYDKECLNVHLKRTVFHLLFDCSHCKQRIIFYNKCSLWMHLKNEESKLNYSDILWLKPYEFDAEDSYENQINEAVDKASPETSAAHPNSAVSSGHNLPASTAVPIDKVTEAESVCNTAVSASPLSSRKRKYIGFISQCPVCAQFFPDLSAHLCPATVRTFPCSTCGMFLPSYCAREAHIKIHLEVAKDICCPECGEKESKIAYGDDVMRSVFDHLDTCKHFNRVISIQCFCKKEHNNTDSLAEHFTENHFRTIFKCPLCVLAFIQHDKFVEHADKIHNIKETNTGATVLCLFCQHVLKSCAELKVHLDQHVEHFKMDATFKWKCFICPKMFTDKGELNKHTDVDHPHKSKRCTICYSLFWSRKSLVEHIVGKKCLRSLAKKLNYCVDMQPDELSKSSKSVNLSNLLEFRQISFEVGKSQKQLNSAPVVSKKPLLVKIAPRIVSKTGQSVAGLQSQPKPQENILISQSVALQKPTPTEVLPTRNKMSTQPCKIIITSKRNSTQFKKSISISQCVVCKQIMESMKLVEHLQLHQSQGIAICLHCQKTDFKTVEEARMHSELCGHSVLKQAENPAQLRSDSSKGADKTPESDSGSTEPNGGASEQQQMDTEEKNVEHQAHSVFPCLLCGLAFQSLSAREEHVSRSHDGIKVVYHCGLCRTKGKTTIFSRKELVSRHITKKHRIGNMDTVSRLIWTEELNANSGQKLHNSSSVEGVSAPKRLRVAGEGDYMCGKCGFSCSKAEEFSQHIASHNSNKEPQCPECGLCFTVFPALKKHLLAVHKIHAVEDYLKTNNVTEPDVDEEFDVFPEIHPYNKPQPKLLDSGREKPSACIKVSPTNPLECTVCYKVFDVEANLKTHMRNHGMAFIRSKRHKV